MISVDRLFLDSGSDEAQKACRKCGEVKPLSEFHRQKGMKDGHRHDCKPCHTASDMRRYFANREERIKKVGEWKRSNRDRVNASQRRRRIERGDELRLKERAGHLRRKYGLRLRDFDTLLYAQLGMCAICRKPAWRKLHVDHDHSTKQVRGLLCEKCNKAIGLLDDEPRLARSAETYLRRTGRVSAHRRAS